MMWMQRMTRLVLMVAALLSGLVLLPAGMAGATDAVVSAPCSEAEFDAALATVESSGGGLITFDCGGEATIIFSAQKEIAGDVRIDGAGLLTLSGGDSTRHFTVLPGGSLNLERLVLERGHSDDGGSIYVEDTGTLNLLDSTLRANRAEFGGAIYLDAGTSGATATISGSTLVENEAYNGSGGAINMVGGGFNSSMGATVTIIDSFLTDNVTSDQGGAIFNDGGSFDTSTGGVLTITGSSLLRNVAGTGGGAIYNNGAAFNSSVGGSLTIIASTLADNVDGGSGGAIYNGGGSDIDTVGGSVVIQRSSIVGNTTSGAGGAIFNSSVMTGGDVQITNSTISGNVADSAGGAIFNRPGSGSGSAGATVTILASTITGNDSLADDGDGVTNGLGGTPGTITLRLAIVAENDTDAGGQDCQGTIISNGRNLDSDDTCQLTRPNDIPGGNADLAPLADNGGPTVTHLPGAHSDALDAGPATCMVIDQRELPRPGGTNCDIGAVEVQPVIVQTVTVCVNRYTGQVLSEPATGCSPTGYYEVVIPNAVAQTFCIDPMTGALSHASSGVCPASRIAHVVPDDGDLLTCASRYTSHHRQVLDHAQCTTAEIATTIPAIT